MAFEFSISRWGGCAPGLHTQSDWVSWAGHPRLPTGDVTAPLNEMPPLVRRRLSGVGRLAAQAAYNCQESDDAANMPVVFASRYGDAVRSLDLISGFSDQSTVSPADFALSVHNAIGAVYSIARRDASNYISVAGGVASVAAAIVEAVGLLQSGSPEVMVVCYDAELPAPYDVFQDEPATRYAWVWRMTKPDAALPRFKLSASVGQCAAQSPSSVLPFGLDVMRFVLSSDAELRHTCDGVSWTLARHV